MKHHVCFTTKESQAIELALSEPEALAFRELGWRLASQKQHWTKAAAPTKVRSDQRTILKCEPTNTPGRYSLVVDNAIGVIRVASIQISIEPKIPIAHFVYLLNLALSVPRFVASHAGVAAGTNLLQLLASWLASALEVLLRRDLYKDYRETRDELDAVRGQLDVQASASNYYTGSLALACIYSEFDEDTSLNRILKAAVESIVRNSIINEITRIRMRRLLARFDGVSALRPNDVLAEPERRSTSYLTAIWIAKAILSGETRTIHQGCLQSWTFLFPTPPAVEEGMRRLLASSLADLCRVEKRGAMLGDSNVGIFPDLRFEPLPAVADIKYKIYGAEWPHGDLYQSVAFAAGLRYCKAAVLSFATAEGPALNDVPFGDIAVRNIRWSASESEQPADSGSDFVTAVRNWLLES